MLINLLQLIFAYDTLDKICHYESHPIHATEYGECQEMAQTICDNLERHRPRASLGESVLDAELNTSLSLSS